MFKDQLQWKIVTQHEAYVHKIHPFTLFHLCWVTIYFYLYIMFLVDSNTLEKRRVNMDPFLHCIYTIGLYTV